MKLLVAVGFCGQSHETVAATLTHGQLARTLDLNTHMHTYTLTHSRAYFTPSDNSWGMSEQSYFTGRARAGWC